MTSAQGSLPIKNRGPVPLQVWVVVAVMLALTGCTVRFIGDYDDTIDKGVMDLEQKTELYLTKLASPSPPAYDQDFYDDVNSRLTVLKSRAAMMPKYPIVADQLTLLQSQFVDLQKLDKMRPNPPLPPQAVGNVKTLMEASFESIERLELSLKERGKATAPALTGKSK